jgi:phospholipid-binding lipoprotein MlaA
MARLSDRDRVHRSFSAGRQKEGAEPSMPGSPAATDGRCRQRQARRLAATVLVIGMLAAPGRAGEVNDPLEPLNRTIFGLNELLDLILIEPVAKAYIDAVPELGRRGVRNLIDHLKAPVVFANDLLQGEGERAGVTLGRFLVNTILGLGLLDVASQVGLPKHGEDFGQTLAVWGMGEGPYLVLPLLGPSNPRDAVGIGVDRLVLDPVPLVAPSEARLAVTAVDVVDTRAGLVPVIDDLRRNSLDRYATTRTVFRQRRAAEIRNGRAPVDSDAYDDIFKEPTNGDANGARDAPRR